MHLLIVDSAIKIPYEMDIRGWKKIKGTNLYTKLGTDIKAFACVPGTNLCGMVINSFEESKEGLIEGNRQWFNEMVSPRMDYRKRTK